MELRSRVPESYKDEDRISFSVILDGLTRSRTVSPTVRKEFSIKVVNVCNE